MNLFDKVASTTAKVATAFERKATPAVAAIRMVVCRGCPFLNREHQTCGRPIIGNKEKYNGRDIELCGCYVKEKTALENEHCPTNKW